MGHLKLGDGHPSLIILVSLFCICWKVIFIIKSLKINNTIGRCYYLCFQKGKESYGVCKVIGQDS